MLVDLSLELLLDAETLTLGPLLGLNGGSQGLHGAGMVLPGVVELLLLLGHTPVNLLSDIGELKLGAEDSVLLHLESGLSLLKSSLELLLLLLKHTALFVKSVDGAATLTELVKEVLDLISEVLVLPLDNIELLQGLLLGGLEAEQLRAVVTALVLGGSNLSREIGGLGLPFSKNLVKVLGALLSDQGSSVDTLVLHGDVIEVSGEPALGLLGVGNLGGQDINELLILDNLGLELVAGSLGLLNAAHALGLIAGLPQLDLSLGLGQSLEGIRLPHGLVLKLLPQVLEVGGHHLVLGEKGSAVLGLSISESLGVLQLSGDRDLGLVHVGNSILELLNLPVEILILNLEPLLGGLGLIEGTGHLIKPGVGVNNGGLEKLALFVKLSLALDSVLEVETGVTEVELHTSLVLLGLDLVGIKAVNLLTKVGHGVVVLHAESGQGSLLGNVQLLKLGLESTELTLALLVELHLGGSVGSSLLKTRGDVLNVLLEHGARLLSLGTVASLNIELLIELLNAGHQLLGLLGVLGGKGGLVVNLGGQGAALLLLAGDSSKKLSLDTLEVRDSLLGKLEVTLKLPLGLLNISLHLLLALKSILSLIESLLQLSLYSGQVVALVLSGLDVLLGLLAAVTDRSLLLGQLANHVRLVSDLVLEGPDLVILVGSVLLSGGKDSLKVADLTLELGNSGVDLL